MGEPALGTEGTFPVPASTGKPFHWHKTSKRGRLGTTSDGQAVSQRWRQCHGDAGQKWEGDDGMGGGGGGGAGGGGATGAG